MALFIACQSNPSTEVSHQDLASAPLTAVMEVRVVQAIQGDFKTQIPAQGMITALKKMDLIWDATGYITDILVKEGSRVKAHTTVAQLSNVDLDRELAQAQINLDQALLKREDLLISGQIDTSSVNKDKLGNIDLLSGYRQAMFDIDRLEKQRQQQRIQTRFDGMIYDISQSIGSPVSPGSVFAKLINTDEFRVDFEILESDIAHIKLGQTIDIVPLADQFKPMQSNIQQIIPVVDQQGLVKVRAKIHHRNLLDGMKVQVLIQQQIPNQIIIPKKAIVIRSGKEVVFSYDDQTGKANWNYVKIGAQNQSHVCIMDGISEGDRVIVEGNLNLNHGSEVSILQSSDQLQ
ncbi:efflux RND transporter periplasmic adaptor subunit [Membranihabitans marinus]|uniref:efflux RND transporter periplasmic adaptor subunit n=1 Tax=Membranihabitans marinus TaxID=1227546 RepID=UPI001F01FE34|nr:efflux RND transporter periplasmic adaptor subunit [Membranihabitans marinus]